MALNDKTRKHNDMDFQKDLSEILTNAKIGLWAIEMDEGKEPRMYFDDVAREITGFYEDMTPEECYERWYKRIVDSAIDSVQARDRKSTRLNSSHKVQSRMPSSA